MKITRVGQSVPDNIDNTNLPVTGGESYLSMSLGMYPATVPLPPLGRGDASILSQPFPRWSLPMRIPASVTPYSRFEYIPEAHYAVRHNSMVASDAEPLRFAASCITPENMASGPLRFDDVPLPSGIQSTIYPSLSLFPESFSYQPSGSVAEVQRGAASYLKYVPAPSSSGIPETSYVPVTDGFPTGIEARMPVGRVTKETTKPTTKRAYRLMVKQLHKKLEEASADLRTAQSLKSQAAASPRMLAGSAATSATADAPHPDGISDILKGIADRYGSDEDLQHRHRQSRSFTLRQGLWRYGDLVVVP